MPIVVYVIILSQFSTPFMFSGVGITLPVIGAEMQASAVELGLVETAFLGAYTAFMLPFGRVSDIMDKNTVFKIGLLVYTLASLALGFVDNIGPFVAIRAVQGLCGAAMAATSMAIVVESVPAEKRGQALGLSIGAIYAGLASAPYLAGLVTDHFGWRWVFYASSICLFLSFVPAVFVMKAKGGAASGRLEIRNSLPLILGVLALSFGAAELDDGIIGESLLAAGILLLIVFVIADRRSTAPLLPLDYLRRNRILSHALLLQMLTYAGAFGMTFLFSLYLQSINGYSALQAGQTLIIGPVLMACIAPFTGRLTDKYSPRVLVAIGIACTATGAGLAIGVAGSNNLFMLIASLVSQGIGFAIFSTPNMAIIMGSVERNRSGFASALTAKTRSIGMVSSMTIITLIMSARMGHSKVSANPQGFLDTMHLTFIILSVLGLFAFIMALTGVFRHKHRLQAMQETSGPA